MPSAPAGSQPATSVTAPKDSLWFDPFGWRRRKTRAVMVGRVGVGGDNPIRVQTMTTTDTLDVEATIAQTIRIAEAGCEIVRITAPTVADSRALGRIKEGLLKRGVDVPLAADIHFSPQAAMEAAEYAEKVRINPGNFADTKRFAAKEYAPAQYARELDRVEEAFTPLVSKLKRLKRALRIGANHGSLSDRILNRYGDTPLGMVESALEYARICEKNGYRDIIFSMKASNPKVMIAAYRLLAARMNELGLDYPFHLGVTEAGDGEDGRIKSAIGIGSLLEDGIGDTIRVSLTEAPELEIPVCLDLARRFQPGAPHPRPPREIPKAPFCKSYFGYERRESDVLSIGPFSAGGTHPVRVVASLPQNAGAEEIFSATEARLKAADGAGPEILEIAVKDALDIRRIEVLREALLKKNFRPAFLALFKGPLELALSGLGSADIACWLPGGAPDSRAFQAYLAAVKKRGVPALLMAEDAGAALLMEAGARGAGIPRLVGVSGTDTGVLLKEYRKLAAGLAQVRSGASIHLKAPKQAGEENQTIQSSILIGSLLCDGIGDSAQIESGAGLKRGLELVYNILQGAGARITKTEFVSCPSCGRTLFDLQTTTERIKARTGHLKGLKIAIMGCIVNGPGEMADADFGYVGGAPGRINLYVGKECVRKGIPAETADEALVDLIKAHGKWADPV